MKMNTKLRLFLVSCFFILNLSVLAQNHWNFTPPASYDKTLTVYLQTTINGDNLNSKNFEVAAFIDGELRGVARPQDQLYDYFGDVYYLYVKGQSSDIGKIVTFKFFDHDNPTEGEYGSDYIVEFKEGQVGSIGSFVTIDFHPVHWTYEGDSDWINRTTVVAQTYINGVLQERTDIEIAAFYGDELRGLTRPERLGDDINYAWFTYLSVAGQSSDTEPLTFKLYDHATGKELLQEETDQYIYANEDQASYGDEDNPWYLNFIAVQDVAQIGDITYPSLNDALAAAVNNDLIKVINNISQTEAVEFPAGMNLTLDLNGYDVEVSGEGSITVSGNLTLVDNAGGASFTTTESNFIINEDAQLYHTLAGINATAVKSIEQTTDGWDGIASPMTAGSILNIETNGINELYYYDETGLEQNGLEWVAMAETPDNSYTLNEAGRGYLYANSVDPNQPQYESSFFFDFEDGTLNGWDNLGGWMLNSDEPIDGSYDLNLPEPSSDGYLVTQNQYAITNSSVLSFDVVRYGARSEYVEYKVFISTDGSNYNRIYTGEAPRNSYETIELKFEDYSEFVGNNVFIAFLYSEGDDSDGMFIDNIRLTSGAKSARADEGAILNFAGVLNHEDVSYDLTYTDSQLLKGFHLLGNPFAHNINVMNVWKETLANGYYAISNRGEWLARSTDNVAEVIAPMEAFLIKAGQAGKLTIRKNAGAKRSSSNGSLMISVTNGELRDDAYVSFNAGIGLDKISHRNENAPMLYIPAQDKNYAVAVMDKEVKEIPLSFEAKQMGQYTISAEALNCEFEELYLIDKQTGTTTNLNLEDYTFIARTGDDEERFVITKSLSGTNPESHDESFIYIDNGDLVVKNIEGEGHVRVFDVLGRPVAEFMAVESARISTERFGNGIYVIQMSDENGVKVQKILID